MRTSLAAKHSLWIGAFVAITTIAMGVFVVREASHAKHGALVRHGAEIAAIVGDRSREAIYTGDREQLRSSLAGLAAAPVVAYAQILGAEGELLASRVMREGIVLPKPLRPDPRAAVGPRYAELRDPERGLRYLDVLVPVRAVTRRGGGDLIERLSPGTRLPQVLGFVQIGLGTQRLDEEVAALERASMAFGGLLAVALGVAASLVSGRLTRPIRRLAALTRDIAGGNFERGVDVTGNDEVGELAGALGIMLERLRDYRSRVKHHQQTLEAQVRERTLELHQQTEEAVELARLAEEASRAKSQFPANEIRTPMNGAMGMTGMAPKGAASPPLPEATVEAEGEVLAHVLIAEDNEVNQRVVIAVLESMGCRVDAVANGQEAVDQLERSSSYDLVFMDCQMPTMDGLAATRAIRAREADAAQVAGGAPVRRLPIVALTAHALYSDRQDCLAAGMDDYLTKPFTKADLRSAIDRAKQGAWAGGQAPAESERPDPPPSALPVPVASISINPAALRRLAATRDGDGSELVARVVNTYLITSQKLLSAIRDAAEAGAQEALANAAHGLNSSSAQVGALRLSNLCKELEALGRDGSCEGARELVNRISAELESVHEGLVAENFGARDG